MRSSSSLSYLRPPKIHSPRSPFTQPTTYRPPSLNSIHREKAKQTNFNHLVQHAIPAAAKGTSGRPSPGIRKEFYFVHFNDRIKFWNLTAGDRVIIADCTKEFRGKIGTIYWVDRTTNRLGLIEPEFWTEEKQIGHPKMPEFVRNTPIEFEYQTVRLMAPGSDEMYYEDLREVQHEAVTVKGRRKEIHWTRIGTRHSIRRAGSQSEGPEIIPWPVTPSWPLAISDSAKRMELRDSYMRLMQAEWERECRRQNGEDIGPPPLPTSHVQSRETRKDLFTDPMQAWKNTLDPRLYKDQSLWLSTSSTIRSRFPDYFGLPELQIPDWELSAGRHTRRAKTERWESKLSEKIEEQIKDETLKISQQLGLTQKELKPIFKMGYYRPSVLSNDLRAPKIKQIKQAQNSIKLLKSKVDNRERLATLDLLPALEEFNSSQKIEKS